MNILTEAKKMISQQIYLFVNGDEYFTSSTSNWLNRKLGRIVDVITKEIKIGNEIVGNIYYFEVLTEDLNILTFDLDSDFEMV